MRIHKEGKSFIFKMLLLLVLLNAVVCLWKQEVCLYTLATSLLVFLFFLNFFRSPNRHNPGDDPHLVYAPADGTVVVIEPTEEPEYLNEKRIQVSIFMSVFNVHANWYPTAGRVLYYAHHNGKFKAAYYPKSSTENERSTVVIETEATGKPKILLRQVAGALARRIVTYACKDQECHFNDHLGFIKFGSRVDLFLPMDAEILVNLKQKTIGNKTVIARLK
jgi:phosphatidylserine decarboxylase